MSEFEVDTIERCPHDQENPYAMISRALIRDETISPECRWLLIFLLSNVNGWIIKIKQLVNHLKGFPNCGRDRVYQIVNEAIEAGYMKRETYQKNNLTRYRYYVSETPKFKKCFRYPGSQDTGAPDPGGQDTLKKDSSSKEEHIQDKIPRRSARRPAAAPIILNEKTKKFEGITEEDIKNWQEAFPAVHVRKEILECQLWAASVYRKNYRMALNSWMRNVNKSHTTPQTIQEKIHEVTQEDIDFNKSLGEKWEREYSGKGGIHYAIFATSNKITFVMPNNEGYSVEYCKPKEEFKRLCQKATMRMLAVLI